MEIGRDWLSGAGGFVDAKEESGRRKVDNFSGFLDSGVPGSVGISTAEKKTLGDDGAIDAELRGTAVVGKVAIRDDRAVRSGTGSDFAGCKEPGVNTGDIFGDVDVMVFVGDDDDLGNGDA